MNIELLPYIMYYDICHYAKLVLDILKTADIGYYVTQFLYWEIIIFFYLKYKIKFIKFFWKNIIMRPTVKY